MKDIKDIQGQACKSQGKKRCWLARGTPPQVQAHASLRKAIIESLEDTIVVRRQRIAALGLPVPPSWEYPEAWCLEFVTVQCIVCTQASMYWICGLTSEESLPAKAV